MYKILSSYYENNNYQKRHHANYVILTFYNLKYLLQ